MPRPINTIEDSVTYSGADITVVAYRNAINEKTEKGIAEIREKIKKQEIEIADKSRFIVDNSYHGEVTDFPSPAIGIHGDTRGHTRERDSLGQEQWRKDAQESITNLEKEIGEKSYTLRPYQTLSNLHTITYSSFREKIAVRTIGRSGPKTYSRGQRTIAGTMVFNSSKKNTLLEFLKGQAEKEEKLSNISISMLDQLPSFNILLIFQNEYGVSSTMHLIDVDIFSEGQEMSIDNVVTNNSLNFYALDIIPLRHLHSSFDSHLTMITGRQGAIDEIIKEGGETNRSDETKKSINRYESILQSRLGEEGMEEEERLLSASRGLR